MNKQLKIIDLNKDIKDYNPKVICLGNFDGLHLGHMTLMDENIRISKEYSLSSAVLFFNKNTKEILRNQHGYLTSLEDKIEIASERSIEYFCIINFDKALLNLKPEEFIKDILIDKLNVKYIVVGEDFRFGYKALGDVNLLKKLEDKYNYKVKIMPLKLLHDKKINSTKIREYITSGNIKKANKQLGYNYKIKGIVIGGQQRGRKLGFPTANLKMKFDYVLPKNGVYFTKVYIDYKQYYAMTDIGTNPSFENKEIKIETYIFNFNKDIYQKDMAIEFIEYIREDIKFDDINALIKQIQADKKVIEEKINQIDKNKEL
ncbi:MAG: bifunctional riboflavin kinase/FAD synthetase [Tissierellia bacterium]|nr:bifunctional riboflavin kinase/FAD synthetase [Tissierellia bacterium]